MAAVDTDCITRVYVMATTQSDKPPPIAGSVYDTWSCFHFDMFDGNIVYGDQNLKNLRDYRLTVALRDSLG